MFIAYRADLELAKLPFVTILICVLCVLIYTAQRKNEADFVNRSEAFCQQEISYDTRLAFSKLFGSYDTGTRCNLILKLQLSAKAPAQQLGELTDNPTAQNLRTDSKDYYSSELLNYFSQYKQAVNIEYLTQKLQYKPETWSFPHMISAAFTHGSWSHLLGNLFFFFAFAATLEIVLGPVYFLVVILGLAIGTHTVYSVAMLAAVKPMPTIGLSGVVMGVMGLFWYLLPMANVRVLFWLLVIFKRFSIPAWVFIGTYVLLDTLELLSVGVEGSQVNLVAHVSGAALGLLMGMIFFSKQKRAIVALRRKQGY